MKFRLSGTVDEKALSEVMSAFLSAGLRSKIDPETMLSVVPEKSEPAPSTGVALSSTEHPPAKQRAKRTPKGNGANWPAPGSIYDIVLQAIQSEPKMPAALKEVLKAAGKSPGSVNSALIRLLKAGKVTQGEGGYSVA